MLEEKVSEQPHMEESNGAISVSPPLISSHKSHNIAIAIVDVLVLKILKIIAGKRDRMPGEQHGIAA